MDVQSSVESVQVDLYLMGKNWCINILEIKKTGVNKWNKHLYMTTIIQIYSN